MSTRMYVCEVCGRTIGNGAHVMQHLAAFLDHEFTEYWLVKPTPSGAEIEVTRGLNSQMLEIRGIRPQKPNQSFARDDELLQVLQEVKEARKTIAELRRRERALVEWVEDDGEYIRKLKRLLGRRFGLPGRVVSDSDDAQ